MKRLLQINPVVRTNTSTGRIMQEIGETALAHGWESHVAYSLGRDGVKPCRSELLPVGDKLSVALHGLATRLFDRHGLASAGATRRFVERVEALSPDIVHIHNLHGYFINYKLLFQYLRRARIPVVWTVHDCWLYTGHCFYYSYIGCDKWRTGCHHCPQRREFPTSLWMDRSARNYRDKREAFNSLAPGQLTIVPVSDWLRREMASSFLAGQRFQVIHNGINTSVFQPCDGEAVRRKYGLRAPHVYIGVASVWSKEKGLPDFADLAARLRADEQLVLVGVKPEQRKRLPEGVVCIGRTDNIAELAALYSAADAFLNPTWQDNYPTVNLEAISCGTPVATYRTGGSVEAITADTGAIVAQGDVEALLAAARAFSMKGKTHWQGRCRAYALAHFRKEERYADYLRLYDSLLNQ